jgi:inner membrane protein
MSSLIAHIAAGLTAYACRASPEPRARSLALLGACMGLAALPDLDYLLWWCLHLRIEPRITHSIGFAAASSGFAWLLLRGGRSAHSASLALTLLAAAASHELLDFLVGVHASPWLWPLSGEPFVSPLGILPSAGRMDVSNVYLWRNLIIEVAVLGPILLAICAARRRCIHLPKVAWIGLAGTEFVALAWSASLPR